MINTKIWEEKAGCDFTMDKDKFHYIIKTEYGDSFSILNEKLDDNFFKTMDEICIIIQLMNNLKNKKSSIIVGRTLISNISTN